MENRLEWNKGGKERKPKKNSAEGRIRHENKIMLQNQKERAVENLQMREIPIMTTINHTLPKVG